MRYSTISFLVIPFLLNCGIAAADPLAASFDEDLYTHSHLMVAVTPDRRLNLFCLGHGEPTVIFDAGWGNWSLTWRKVQPQVASFTTACSYDRAGLGFSDGAELPRDTEALTNDEHALIGAAGIKSPYILVGHSLAGLSSILYANRYQAELAGMVLVDPSLAHQSQVMASVPGLTELLVPIDRMVRTNTAACADAARNHSMPTIQELISWCLDHNSGFGPALVATTDSMASRVDHWQDAISELGNFETLSGGDQHDPDSAELDASKRSLGALNIIVLTAGKSLQAPGMTEAQKAALSSAWKAAHDELAARSTRGQNILVPNSSHYIQDDEPQVVIDQIYNVVVLARRASSN